MQLTKSARSVQAALDVKGLNCKVLELPNSTRTAQDAAIAIGCNVAQIVKSLIFKTQSSNQPVLILASGPNMVNELVIELHLKEKIIKADASFSKEITGFAIGGIPPIGHQQLIEHIFIDQDLLRFNDIWAAAGTPNAVFNLKPSDLLTMTNGRVISIVQ